MIGMKVGQEERSHVVAHDTAGWRYRLPKAFPDPFAAVHNIVSVTNRHDRRNAALVRIQPPGRTACGAKQDELCPRIAGLS